MDAALLSALRDPRERVALLRLEQKLVEFANDPTLTQVDVGPGSSGGDAGGTNLTSTGVITEDEKYSANPASNAINRELQNMNLRTSFHRKCLHKLADRFRISRETTDNNAIRLIKGKDSRAPNKLLIDLTIGSGSVNTGRNIHPNHPNASTGTANGTAGGPVSPVGMVSSAHPPQDRIGDTNNNLISTTEGLSCIQLSSQVGGGKKSKKKDKIKIFKRSIAQKGSSGSLNNKDGGDLNNSNSRRKKNLGDKEKAYAEARARIFNSSSGNTSSKSNIAVQANSIDESSYEQGHSNFPPYTTTVAGPSYQDANTTAIASGGRKFTPNPTSLGEFCTTRLQASSPVLDAPPPLSSSSATTSTTATSATLSSSSLHCVTSINDPSTEPANVSTSTPTINNRGSNNAPAAVTSGATSKVTWRNRQQEASDPDFQRGVHVVGGLGVPMTAVAPPAVSYHYHNNPHLHHHPTPSAHQCGGMPSAAIAHNLMNGYHYPTGSGGGGVGAGPGTTGGGGGMLDLSVYHHAETASSWQRQDDGGGCGVTATAVHQSQQIPPVIFSSPTPSAHHGQYQVLSQPQHQYPSSIGLPLGGNSAGNGGMSIATNQQRHRAAPLIGDAPGGSNGTRHVYTAEDFPALG